MADNLSKKVRMPGSSVRWAERNHVQRLQNGQEAAVVALCDLNKNTRSETCADQGLEQYKSW